jgi:hypothetical protein
MPVSEVSARQWFRITLASPFPTIELPFGRSNKQFPSTPGDLTTKSDFRFLSESPQGSPRPAQNPLQGEENLVSCCFFSLFRL